MHSLEPELRTLHTAGLIDDATAARALARARGEVFSLHAELRLVLYAGVLLVMAGVGIILARNLDRIGPLAVAAAMALAAIGCSVPALRAKAAGRNLTVASDYLLLLAALLLSADLAYVERQFVLLGPAWSWHLLLLAVIHAAIAYTFASTLVLAASLAALAGWFGVGSFGDVLGASRSGMELGVRALACAALILAWRHADRRVRPDTRFGGVFDHFVANLAFWGAIAWCADGLWALAGLPLLAVLAFASARRGLDTGREAFIVYGTVYTALGVCVAALPRVHGEAASLSFLLLVVCVASAALWKLRQRLKEPRQ